MNTVYHQTDLLSNYWFTVFDSPKHLPTTALWSTMQALGSGKKFITHQLTKGFGFGLTA
jgi:hypothetical protein